MTRDKGGKFVRETWVKYVLETVDDPKHSHIVPWGDMLSELDKEADRRIFDAVKSALEPKRGKCGYRYHDEDCDCGGMGGDR